MPSVAAARRHDLTDVQWAVLEPLLPGGTGHARPRRWTMRVIIDGIRWRVRTGSPWRDVPGMYPPWQTLYRWFRRWQRDGVWAQILSSLQAQADAAVNGGLELTPPGQIKTDPRQVVLVYLSRFLARSSRRARVRNESPARVRTSAWWTSRSIIAAATTSSPKTSPQRPNGKFDVTKIEACS